MTFGLSKPHRALANSWLNDPDQCRELDGRVRTQFGLAHKMRGLEERPPPFTVDLFVDRVRATRYKQWFVITSGCAFLGELLWVAHDLAHSHAAKGIYGVPEKYQTSPDAQRHQHHRPLQALRNVCAHPALILTGTAPSAMDRLVQIMKSPAVDDVALAEFLEQDWSRIHQRALAAWAIRRIDLAGRHELGAPARDVT